ncbi:hypothetical protein C0Z01_09755 [Photobacterium kishitanii]|uniref:Uncharacterized protein n=1 Tax=Photobacterium kishitanii TaxID=318456 RepID=A0A2T3KJC4_9GAMM|nr:hypothetical protein [Photobacterium kishitanii]KJG59035.1 hypothetical protein UA38_04720 [Photobacterium kishitanii]KJG62041.1 hypothetical protein UA42_06415 [Photobacterium kishitanii]KJG67227.1 hypothetical protein UA40_04725 [Photobacterium kishitanii]KJG70527.1 hypothetical protein UA41_04670 [Photobacterium kishitanii]OBU29261.1 hypothetical protein AYY22_01705 [Photobacterium kishitanii]
MSTDELFPLYIVISVVVFLFFMFFLFIQLYLKAKKENVGGCCGAEVKPTPKHKRSDDHRS